jgi:GAF domain-containing protein
MVWVAGWLLATLPGLWQYCDRRYHHSSLYGRRNGAWAKHAHARYPAIRLDGLVAVRRWFGQAEALSAPRERPMTQTILPSTLEATLAAARDLAWTGQHAQAIEQVTQALSAPKLKPAAQLDLLDLRAESYVAQGQLDLAAQDAARMIKLAKGAKQARLKAQALNRQALVQMRLGELVAAVKTATAALKAAKLSRHKPFVAESLFRLAEAQFRARLNEPALQSAQQAADLYRALGDPAGQGRAWWAVASGCNNLGRNDESRRAAQTALALCQQAGDQYGTGNALNVLTFSELDWAPSLKILNRARQAFEAAGYLERQTVIIGNLGGAYSGLGLYRRARRLQAESADICRRIGARLGLAYALGNLAEVEVRLGQLEAARRHTAEFAEMTPALGDPKLVALAPLGFGLIALAEGDPPTASAHFESATRHAHEMEVIAAEVWALVLQAQVHLANGGDAAAALTATARATDLHRAQGLGGLDTISSQEVWWRHSQALAASRQPQAAREALEMAYGFMLQGIATLSDEGLRRNYLNKIQVNREIIAAWLKDGRRRKLPPEKHLAHLAGEANLREPFQRLVDSGLRLNELRTAAELHEFLIDEATELSGAERVLLVLETPAGLELAGSQLPTGEDAQALLAAIAPQLARVRRARTVQLTSADQLPSGVTATPRRNPHRRSGKSLGPAGAKNQTGVLSGSGGSQIIAPLIAQNQLLGYLYADLSAPFGSLRETDRDMLGLLASQASVALDNANWAQGLEQKVKERTEELNARVDELAILNSVGEAMAKTLDVRTVTRIVGDKVQSIFASEAVTIHLYDAAAKLIRLFYHYDRGYQDTAATMPLGQGLTSRIILSGKPLRFDTLLAMNQEGALKINPRPEEDEEETQSYLGVPIIVSDRVMGVVTIQSYKPHAYDDNSLRLLQTLSANMGVAIENARLFEAEQQRVAELAIINSVQAALAAELNMQQIYDAVGDKIREIFHRAHDVGIRIYDPRTNLVHYPYLYEKGQRITVASEPLSKKGFGPHVLRTRQTLVVNENLEQEMAKYGSYNLPGTQTVKSLVYVPLVAGDQARGLIGLADLEREHAFGDSDVRLLQTLANSMSVALENARLFEETQRLLKETEQRAAELATVNTASQAIATQLELETLIPLIGEQMRQTFQADIVYVALLDQQTNLIHFPYSFGEELPPLQLGQGLTSKVLETGQPLLLNEDVNVRVDALGPPASASRPGPIWACRSWRASRPSASSACRARAPRTRSARMTCAC